MDVGGYFSKGYTVDLVTSHKFIFGKGILKLYGNGGLINDYGDYFLVVPLEYYPVFLDLFDYADGELKRLKIVDKLGREHEPKLIFESRSSNLRDISGIQLGIAGRVPRHPPRLDLNGGRISSAYVNTTKLLEALKRSLEGLLSVGSRGVPRDAEGEPKIFGDYTGKVVSWVRRVLDSIEKGFYSHYASGADPEFDPSSSARLVKESIKNLVSDVLDSTLYWPLTDDGWDQEGIGAASRIYEKVHAQILEAVSGSFGEKLRKVGGVYVDVELPVVVPEDAFPEGALEGSTGKSLLGVLGVHLSDGVSRAWGPAGRHRVVADEARLVVLPIGISTGNPGVYRIMTVSFPVYLVKEPRFSFFSFLTRDEVLPGNPYLSVLSKEYIESTKGIRLFVSMGEKKRMEPPVTRVELSVVGDRDPAVGFHLERWTPNPHGQKDYPVLDSDSVEEMDSGVVSSLIRLLGEALRGYNRSIPSDQLALSAFQSLLFGEILKRVTCFPSSESGERVLPSLPSHARTIKINPDVLKEKLLASLRKDPPTLLSIVDEYSVLGSGGVGDSALDQFLRAAVEGRSGLGLATSLGRSPLGYILEDRSELWLWHSLLYDGNVALVVGRTLHHINPKNLR